MTALAGAWTLNWDLGLEPGTDKGYYVTDSRMSLGRGVTEDCEEAR